jgi:DNA-binding response OmpR family regulator
MGVLAVVANNFAAGEVAAGEVIRSGPLTLDLAGFRVAVAGKDMPLTRAEFLLMAAFISQPYRVFDREALASIARRFDRDPGDLHCSPRAIDVCIARLRRKLRAANAGCIQTMRFVGYRFVPPVEDRQPIGRPQ